ncbi:MAG TPA: class I SAM-dependent methyltransferase [Methylobacter sp.]
MNKNSSNMSLKEGVETSIGTMPCITCALCGHKGEFLYSNQQDRLFGANGSWNLKQCVNQDCGLIWLDPMPLKEEIGKAYASYYTHTPRDPSKRPRMLRRIRNLIERGYLAKEYNYEIGSRPLLTRILGNLLYLLPIYRNEADAGVRCLPALPGGRLLDVGCGTGEWLLSMRQRGWQVEGIDFDENAVKVAVQQGLLVHCNSLEQHGFPDDYFDAVTFNHLIEHVPDPVQTLAECTRILKPGGKLVILTPNNASFTHRVFKQDWRGLEPPRHLHIFSMLSMRRALAMAGFNKTSIYPLIATSIIYESILLRRNCTASAEGSRRNWSAKVSARIFKLLEFCILKWKPELGDCLIAIAEKAKNSPEVDVDGLMDIRNHDATSSSVLNARLLVQ